MTEERLKFSLSGNSYSVNDAGGMLTGPETHVFHLSAMPRLGTRLLPYGPRWLLELSHSVWIPFSRKKEWLKKDMHIHFKDIFQELSLHFRLHFKFRTYPHIYTSLQGILGNVLTQSSHLPSLKKSFYFTVEEGENILYKTGYLVAFGTIGKHQK